MVGRVRLEEPPGIKQAEQIRDKTDKIKKMVSYCPSIKDLFAQSAGGGQIPALVL
jgi:hypothetical protein